MLRHFHFESLDSTQDEAFRLAEGGEATPFYVTADEQKKGRGRMKREWVSERGRSLTMSCALEMPASKLLGLSLITGLAVRDALEMPKVQIKWPNDLMLDDSKVGGILVESRSQNSKALVVIGVGLNLLHLQSASYVGINKSLHPQLIANKIIDYIDRFIRLGFSEFRGTFESHLWKLNDQVVFMVDGVKRAVRIRGVSDEGLLQIEDGQGLKLTDQGEISLVS